MVEAGIADLKAGKVRLLDHSELSQSDPDMTLAGRCGNSLTNSSARPIGSRTRVIFSEKWDPASVIALGNWPICRSKRQPQRPALGRGSLQLPDPSLARHRPPRRHPSLGCPNLGDMGCRQFGVFASAGDYGRALR